MSGGVNNDEALHKERKYSCVQSGTAVFVCISAMLAYCHCCNTSYHNGDNVSQVLQIIMGVAIYENCSC